MKKGPDFCSQAPLVGIPPSSAYEKTALCLIRAVISVGWQSIFGCFIVYPFVHRRKEVEITFCDVQRTKKKYKFTDEERLSFVLFGILYASRCNNFHGNVAARMNSINANKDTFKMYTDMFLTEYIILAIHLNSQGALSDMVLNKVKGNANLMV